MSQDDFNLSLIQAAKILNVSLRSVQRLIQAGKLASMKIGARRLIPRSVVNTFIADQTGQRLKGGAHGEH